MPTYDFKCKACGTTFEAPLERGAMDFPHHDCGNGRMGATVRLITPPNIQFKGPGFYNTDSK